MNGNIKMTETNCLEKGIDGYHWQNWAEIYSCNPSPNNIEALREIIYSAKENNKKIRVVGCGKSPNDIVCTPDYMVSLKNFKKILSIDEQKKTVTVESGMTFTELNPILEKRNLSITVLGSISDISIGGAISVANHGSGPRYKVLSDYVIELDLLTSSGEVIKCTRNENTELLHSVLCGLGAFGIILNVTLQLETLFYVHSFVQTVSLEEVIEDIYEYLESDYPRLYWFPHTEHVVVNHSNRIKNGRPTKFNILERMTNWLVLYGIGYYCIEFAYYVATYVPQLIPFINRTFFKIVYSKQEEVVNVSYKSFQLECLFKQYVNEWSIPVESTSLVLLQMRRFFEENKNVYAHFPIEIRFVKGDELYLSPAYGRDSCYINIVNYKPYGREHEFAKYWEYFETTMKELGGRPHWSKLGSAKYGTPLTGTDFIKMYSMFRPWLQIKKRTDPISMFSNNFITNYLLE